MSREQRQKNQHRKALDIFEPTMEYVSSYNGLEATLRPGMRIKEEHELPPVLDRTWWKEHATR